MEIIDLNKDIAKQVRFFEHIAHFAVAEADAVEDDENAKALWANGCGDCVSVTVYGYGGESQSILVAKADARKLGEYLIAIADI